MITDSKPGAEAVSEATIKLLAGGARIITTGEGNGPVNALDQALRHAIGQAYPEVAKFELIDYKVRILDQGHGTDAVTRVLIETSDGESRLGHGRGRAQRHRGVVGGAPRRGDLRAAPQRRAAGVAGEAGRTAAGRPRYPDATTRTRTGSLPLLAKPPRDQAGPVGCTWPVSSVARASSTWSPGSASQPVRNSRQA